MRGDKRDIGWSAEPHDQRGAPQSDISSHTVRTVDTKTS